MSNQLRLLPPERPAPSTSPAAGRGAGGHETAAPAGALPRRRRHHGPSSRAGRTTGSVRIDSHTRRAGQVGVAEARAALAAAIEATEHATELRRAG